MKPETSSLIAGLGEPAPIVKFARLDPFNSSFADLKNNVIYIDKKLEDTNLEIPIVKHELGHMKNKGLLFENIDGDQVGTFVDLLKYKPLMLFQLFFPFALAQDQGKVRMVIDPLGVVMLGILLAAFFFVFGYSEIRCVSNVFTPGLPAVKECFRCTLFTGCLPV